MIFVYQKGMLVTRLGKMARFPGERRDEFAEARFPGLNLEGLGNSPGTPPLELGACLKTDIGSRVRARGLQKSTRIPVVCRPGPLTGRVSKQVPSACRKTKARRPRAQSGPDEARDIAGNYPCCLKKARPHPTLSPRRGNDPMPRRTNPTKSNQIKPAGRNQGLVPLEMKLALTLTLSLRRGNRSTTLWVNPTISNHIKPAGWRDKDEV
jgi:hypothetical protein